MRKNQAATPREWSVNTLDRATAIGQRTLNRAAERKVEWPKQNWKKVPQEEPTPYTTLDDAFDTVLQFMSQTTRQCRRYYENNPPRETEEAATCHCRRFHTPARFAAAQYRHPLQCRKDVHVVVPPGSYAVSASPWSGQVETTSIVDVRQGQTLDLDFIV